MTIELGNYILTKKTTYWFYHKDRIPKYAVFADEMPEGYEIVRNVKNNYPFLKRILSQEEMLKKAQAEHKYHEKLKQERIAKLKAKLKSLQ